MTTRVLPRSEVAVEHTWDATSVYPSDEAWAEELKSASARLAEAAQFQGRLSEGPETLLAWLSFSDDLTRLVGHLYVYANMFSAVDTADQAAQSKSDQVTSLFGLAAAAIAFAEPELLALGRETLQQWGEEEAALATLPTLL